MPYLSGGDTPSDNLTVPVHRALAWCGCLLALLVPRLGNAQPSAADADAARFQFGPLAATPTLAIRDVGIDSNVFNEADAPTSDFTATVVPGVDTWFRASRLTLASSTTIEWVHYQDAARQRSLNVNEESRLELNLLRARPYVGGTYVRTRRRPNPEIDNRVRQFLTGGYAGVEVDIGARMTADVVVGREKLDVGQGEFGDAGLAFSLNRKTERAGADLSWSLTPLTAFVVRSAYEREAFEFDTDRDNRSIIVTPGVEFDPLAVIRGSAFVGIRHLEGLHATLPQFTGVIADVQLGWTFSDLAQMTAVVERDIEYSAERDYPYFVLTGFGVTATQVIGASWDVVGRGGWTRLNYVAEEAPAGMPGLDPRVDRIWTIGTGVGRRLGDRLRVGVDVNYGERQSPVPGRTYDGFTVGGVFTYGY